MPVRVQLRRGTAAQWSLANPILAEGEPGYVTDDNRFKIGDGVTAWNALAYPPGTDTQKALALAPYAGVPSAPPATNVTLYQNPGFFPSVMDEFGVSRRLSTPIQNLCGTYPVAGALRNVQLTGTPTTVGTGSYPALNTSSLLDSMYRYNIVSASGTNQVAALRHTLWSGIHRTYFSARFSINTSTPLLATQVFLVGVNTSSSAIAGTTRPETLSTQGLYLGNSTGHSNLSLYDITISPSVKITSLGANFPVPSTVNKEVYDLEIYTDGFVPSRLTYWCVTRVSTGHKAFGESANYTWSVGTTQTAHFWTSTGNTSSTCGISFHYLNLAVL